jgi:hypothetical protein
MALFSASADAAVLAYEGFDIAGPGVNGNGSGFGWNVDSGAGAVGWIDTGPDFEHVKSGSLDSAAFPFSPVGNRVEGTGGSTRRLFDFTLDLSQDATQFFVSYLLRKDDTGAGTARNVELGLWTTTNALPLRFGSTSSNQGTNADESRFFFGGSGGTQNSTIPVTYGETYFLVLKSVASAASSDLFYAAIYDPSETVPATEPATWDIEYSFSSNLIISQARLAYGASALGAIDEIRIGQTWADVTAPAVAAQPGDFDGDGDVDGADFVAWQTNFPKASGATLAEGDADGDGDVDGADFVVWQTNFPFTPGGGASPIPEPGSIVLTIFGSLAIVASRRSLRRGDIQWNKAG